MKKKYRFIVEKKVTVWKRTIVEVESSSERNALRDVIDYKDNVDIVDEEYLFETEDALDPKDNGNQPTMEIFNKYPYIEENSIYNNVIRYINIQE